MPVDQNSPLFTYETRLSVPPEQEQLLRPYATRFGQVERKLFAAIQSGKAATKLQSEYLVRFDRTARQFNAVRMQLEGKISAIRERLPLQIEDLKRKIRKAQKVIVKLVRCMPRSKPRHQKRRRWAPRKARLERLKADPTAGRVRICLGSRKLFHAQFHLPENGFGSHAEWREAGTEARSRQFFILGSKDEKAGCQGWVAIRDQDGSDSLRIRLPNGLKGRFLFITGTGFAYGQEKFEESLACGRALSYRFLQEAKGWRVFVSTEASQVKPTTHRGLGAIGIDINPDQLVLAEVDRQGNFMGGEHRASVTYGKTKKQAKAILGEVAKQAIQTAVRTGKPMVIERLEFAKKRAELAAEGRKRARMLSCFAYHQTIQYLKAAAFRAGVEVIEVNPAYTSTIGAVNYAARFGISTHQGAALAIARRGLNLSERPTVRVAQLPTGKGDHVTLPLPARTRSRHVWLFWSNVSRRIRAAHVAHLRLLPAIAGSTPGLLCGQALCAT